MADVLSRTLVAFFVAVAALSVAPSAHAAVEDWQRGANMRANYDTHFSSAEAQESMRRLKATGANYISFVLELESPWFTSSSVNRVGATPTDESLRAAINFAHSLGLAVNLKPHVEAPGVSWRAYINPGDRTAWFASYREHVLRFARIAEESGAEMFTVGTELISLASGDEHPDNTGHWRALIAAVREVYGGSLT